MTGQLTSLELRWLEQPLARKGMVVIAVPVLILFVALFTVVHEVQQEEAAEATVRQALNVQTSLQRLETLIYRAALDAALTPLPPPDKPQQQHLQALHSNITQILQDLHDRVSDDVQRAQLRSMAPVTQQLVATLYHQTGAARAPTNDEYGPSLAAFDVALSRMKAREAALLKTRSTDAESARARSLLVIGMAVMVGLWGTVAAVLLFSSAVVKRITRLAQNAHTLFSVDFSLTDEPGKHDEIGALGKALDHAAQLLAQRQQRLEELVARLFEVQEEERRRVAYQLHDGLAQVAAAAHQHLQAFAAHYPPTQPEAQAALQRGLSLVQRSVRETREAIAGLRPTVLDDLGLFAALDIEANALRHEGHAVTCQNTTPTERFTPVVETALFRIAQEALTNVRKHAGLQANVNITLGSPDGQTLMIIQDDGRGFSSHSSTPQTRAPGEKIGLEVMRERAQLVGAQLQINSNEEQGTTVRVVVA